MNFSDIVQWRNRIQNSKETYLKLKHDCNSVSNWTRKLRSHPSQAILWTYEGGGGVPYPKQFLLLKSLAVSRDWTFDLRVHVSQDSLVCSSNDSQNYNKLQLKVSLVEFQNFMRSSGGAHESKRARTGKTKIYTNGFGLVRQFRVRFVSLIPCLAFQEINCELCIIKK